MCAEHHRPTAHFQLPARPHLAHAPALAGLHRDLRLLILKVCIGVGLPPRRGPLLRWLRRRRAAQRRRRALLVLPMHHLLLLERGLLLLEGHEVVVLRVRVQGRAGGHHHWRHLAGGVPAVRPHARQRQAAAVVQRPHDDRRRGCTAHGHKPVVTSGGGACRVTVRHAVPRPSPLVHQHRLLLLQLLLLQLLLLLLLLVKRRGPQARLRLSKVWKVESVDWEVQGAAHGAAVGLRGWQGRRGRGVAVGAMDGQV